MQEVHTLGLESVFALELGRLLADLLDLLGARTTYRGSGGTVEGLLALDGDIGAIGSLELDLKVGWVALLVRFFLRSTCEEQHASLGVVEVLVNELDACLSVSGALVAGSMAQLTSLAALLRSP